MTKTRANSSQVACGPLSGLQNHTSNRFIYVFKWRDARTRHSTLDSFIIDRLIWPKLRQFYAKFDGNLRFFYPSRHVVVAFFRTFEKIQKFHLFFSLSKFRFHLYPVIHFFSSFVDRFSISIMSTNFFIYPKKSLPNSSPNAIFANFLFRNEYVYGR